VKLPASIIAIVRDIDDDITVGENILSGNHRNIRRIVKFAMRECLYCSSRFSFLIWKSSRTCTFALQVGAHHASSRAASADPATGLCSLLLIRYQRYGLAYSRISSPISVPLRKINRIRYLPL
jgi:hypothetical protein